MRLLPFITLFPSSRNFSISLLTLLVLLAFACQNKAPYDQLVEKYLTPYSASADIETDGVPNPSWRLGLSKFQEGEYEDMEEAFMKLRPGNPFYYKAHYLMANLNLQQRDPWKAIDHLKAAKSNPDTKYFKDAQWLFALAYLQANVPARAKDLLREITQSNPPHPYREKALQLLDELE